MNNKGQSIFSEYVMIFFVVIAAAVAMTTFVQRSLEARLHDARDILIQQVNSACDANCMQATGSSAVPYEYEPYYEKYLALVQNNEKDTSGTMPGQKQVIGVIYQKTVNGEANTNTTSYQLPPICISPNPPPCCSSFNGCVCSCPAGTACGPDSCGDPKACGKC